MKKITTFLYFAILALTINACGGGGASATSSGPGTATISWTPPAANTDGTPLIDLAGYRIYYGTSSRQYDNVDTLSAGITSYVVENLAAGTWYFAISAFNTSGNESAKSGELRVNITDN